LAERLPLKVSLGSAEVWNSLVTSIAGKPTVGDPELLPMVLLAGRRDLSGLCAADPVDVGPGPLFQAGAV
jgi:hypothetical protein